jgi:hypothetical protein
MNDLEGIGPEDGQVMCLFVAKNSENGLQRAHLVYKGIEYRWWDVNTFEGYLW